MPPQNASLGAFPCAKMTYLKQKGGQTSQKTATGSQSSQNLGIQQYVSELAGRRADSFNIILYKMERAVDCRSQIICQYQKTQGTMSFKVRKSAFRSRHTVKAHVEEKRGGFSCRACPRGCRGLGGACSPAAPLWGGAW